MIFPEVVDIVTEGLDTKDVIDRKTVAKAFFSKRAREEADEAEKDGRDLECLNALRRAVSLDPSVTAAKNRVAGLEASKALVQGKVAMAEGSMDEAIRVLDEGLAHLAQSSSSEHQHLKTSLEEARQDCDVISEVELVTKRLVPDLAGLRMTDKEKRDQENNLRKAEAGDRMRVAAEEQILPYFKGSLNNPVCSELYYTVASAADSRAFIGAGKELWSEAQAFNEVVMIRTEAQLTQLLLNHGVKTDPADLTQSGNSPLEPEPEPEFDAQFDAQAPAKGRCPILCCCKDSEYTALSDAALDQERDTTAESTPVLSEVDMKKQRLARQKLAKSLTGLGLAERVDCLHKLLVEAGVDQSEIQRLKDAGVVKDAAKLNEVKVQLFSNRRTREREAARMHASMRSTGVDVSPLHAAIELRDELLVQHLVGWITSRTFSEEHSS